MDEILLIDKPAGITSFDVIRRLRRKLGVRKMGHAGTLDPAASGLMIIGVGEGTKKLSDYLKLDKEYEAEILVGVKTDSGDRDGKVVEEKTVTKEAAAMFSSENIAAALASLVGTIALPVSAYSAIKEGGVPWYKKARAAAARGQTIAESDLPRREMKVISADLQEIIDETGRGRIVIKARFAVGSGAYIRSLAAELGRRLGYPASLRALRRVKIGDFDIKDAQAL